jgi:hypothetical protein
MPFRLVMQPSWAVIFGSEGKRDAHDGRKAYSGAALRNASAKCWGPARFSVRDFAFAILTGVPVLHWFCPGEGS